MPSIDLAAINVMVLVGGFSAQHYDQRDQQGHRSDNRRNKGEGAGPVAFTKAISAEREPVVEPEHAEQVEAEIAPNRDDRAPGYPCRTALGKD